MSVVKSLGQALTEANQVASEDLARLRRGASKFFLGYLCVMACVVTVLAELWSDHWIEILVLNAGFVAAAVYAHWRAPDAVQTRVTIAVAMLANWMNLIYASSGLGAGEFILDAHMIYFVLNAILLSYFCWRTLLVVNVLTVIHHFGLNFAAPLLIWPSANLSLYHLAAHALMALTVTASGLTVSVKVCQLFHASERAMNDLKGEMAERARLEAEDKRMRAEVAAREEQERQRQAAEQEKARQAEEAAHQREIEEARAREARRAKEEAELQQKSEEQSRMVGTLALALDRLSQGDLSVTIDEAFPAAYETLRIDFNATVSSLAHLMQEVADSISAINNTSREISSATEDLARRTEESAVRLERTSSSVREVTELVETAAAGAKSTNAVAETANARANESTRLVTDAVAAMTKIEESSRQIGSIVDVIGDIAFQTNLLALNAGVEAARAGEVGRGFAVVASEVRALAQRSSEAAREINALITSSDGQVRDGSRMVGTAGTALSDIIGAMAEIAKAINGIAGTSDDQTLRIQAVNAAIVELDSDMQQNAAMTEETAAAVQCMFQEADRLTGMISKFSFERTDGRGIGSAAA